MRGTRLWLSTGIAALVASASVAAGCGSDNSSSSSTSASSGDVTTITDGTLLIATDAPYPPFEIGTPADSDFGGFDIDLANAVAEKLGLTPEFQDTSFDTIFRDVAAGQFDIVVAASTITPGRQKTVNFSDPYYEAQQALVVPTGSDITSVDDLTGKIVGAQDATTGETYANDETDAGEVRGFPEGPDAISAVVTGQVDAAIIDQPVAVDAVDKTDGIEIAAEIPTNELYGMALSKENTALLDAVNNALVEMKGDGTITDLYQKYFQIDPPKSVLDGTTTNPG
jgi:polar amino acid transport system substrate-binding protein